MRATHFAVVLLLLISSACSPMPMPGEGWTKVHSVSTTGLGVLAVDGDSILELTDKGVDISTDDGATWTTKGMGAPMLPSETVLVLSDRILLGAEVGVYTSTNHAESFTRTDTGLPTNVSPYALFDTGTAVLIGMNVGSGDPGVEGGLFRTTNKGMTWSKSSMGLPQISSATAFAKLNNAIYASVAGGVGKSTDDGATWTVNPIPAGNALGLVLLNGTLFCSTSANTIIKSMDGVTWTSTGATGLPASNPIDLLYAFDGKLYATAFASENNGVFVSSDSGATWTGFNAGLSVNNSVPRVISMVQHGTRLFALDGFGNVWRR